MNENAESEMYDGRRPLVSDFDDQGRKIVSQPWKAKLDSVAAQKDFFELFRDWEDKKLPINIQNLKYELIGGPHSIGMGEDIIGSRLIAEREDAQSLSDIETIKERLRVEHLEMLGKQSPI